MKESTIKILYEMRKALDKKILWHKVVSFFFVGLLIINFILFSLLRRFDMMGWIGAVLAFIWCIFAVYTMFKLKEEQNNIDEFYLLNLSGEKNEKRKK